MRYATVILQNKDNPTAPSGRFFIAYVHIFVIISIKGKDMKSQKFDKRLLVNLAKGTTAWAVITGLCTLPAVLFSDKDNIADNALLVFMAAGIVAPWIYTVNGGKNIGQQYVDAFDYTAAKIRNTISGNKKTKIK